MQRRWIALAATTMTLVAAGCGSDDATTKTADAKPAETGFPVTITSGERTVEIEERPTSIVSLSPTATEMLYAIDAGDQVVAVDDQSNFPEDAPRTKLSGFEPNVEAIVGENPDLVIVSNDPGGLVDALEKVDVDVLVQPAVTDFDGAYEQIEDLGKATGNDDGATQVVEQMRTSIAKLVEEAPEFAEPLTYYHELDPSFYSAASDTFIGAVYGAFGLVNIADAKDTTQTAGYPQLSAEYILDEDPDLVFLADAKCCDQDAATVAKRAGWDTLDAVRNGGVVELDDDIASRWGPRTVELMEQVGASLDALQAARAS